MRRILIGLSGAIAMLLGTVNAFANDGFGIGVRLGHVNLDATGSEVEGGESTSKSINRSFPMGSIFAEFTKGAFTIGIDHVPFKANVSGSTLTRTDTETSGAHGATIVATSVTQNQAAQARILDHNTYYVEMGSKAYVKAGYTKITVETQESLGTGSTYGDADLNGILVGLGVKGDWGNHGFYKIEGTYTDYDTLNVTSGVARAGVSTNNKISADLDTVAANILMGYKF